MNEKRHTTPRHLLTGSQKSRVEFARRDLDHARSEDLAQLDKPDLILLFERLRGRLNDMIDLVDEIADTTPRPHL